MNTIAVGIVFTELCPVFCVLFEDCSQDLCCGPGVVLADQLDLVALGFVGHQDIDPISGTDDGEG